MNKVKPKSMCDGPVSTDVSSATPPSGEGKQTGDGNGQSSGKVQHMRSGNNIENMNHMPKNS